MEGSGAQPGNIIAASCPLEWVAWANQRGTEGLPNTGKNSLESYGIGTGVLAGLLSHGLDHSTLE